MADVTRERRRELRKFGLVVGGILLAMAALWILRHRHPLAARINLAIGGALVVGGVLAPTLLAPLHRVWMALAGALGWFNSRVLLGFVFYVLLAPIGLVLRLLGRDPLSRHFDRKRTTYWHERTEPDDPERFKRQF